MVYTLTFNPALDYVVTADKIIEGAVNRSLSEKILAGGKGINVSVVLSNLNVDSCALGFIAGFTGDEIERLTKEKGCKTDFIRLYNGNSRINVKIKTNCETEINASGPTILKEDIEKLYSITDNLCENDILVLAGSIPKSLNDTIYYEIMDRLKGKNIKVVVDAEKKLLLNVLPLKPFLIKPNNHELCAMFEIEDTFDKNEIAAYALKLKEKGAQNVLVSMAGDGAVLVTENDEIYFAEAPKGNVISSVGSGDSMVAGFLAGYHYNKDYHHAFKTGLAAGSASAFSENLCTKEEVEEIFKGIAIKKIK